MANATFLDRLKWVFSFKTHARIDCYEYAGFIVTFYRGPFVRTFIKLTHDLRPELVNEETIWALFSPHEEGRLYVVCH